MKRWCSAFLVLCFSILFVLPHNSPVKSNNNNLCSLDISHKLLDFDRWPVGSHPSMSFAISVLSDVGLKGEIYPSANWIKLSKSSFEGLQVLIDVSLDLSELPPKLYKETIQIKTNIGDYSLPVRVDLVEKRSVVQIIIDNPYVFVNGKDVLLPAASFIYHGYIYVPLRTICEAFGATVSYKREESGKYRITTVTYQDRKVEFFSDQNFMVVNGIKIDIPEQITNRFGVTFIPVVYLKNFPLPRFPDSLTRSLFNCDIQYIDETRTTTLIY